MLTMLVAFAALSACGGGGAGPDAGQENRLAAKTVADSTSLAAPAAAPVLESTTVGAVGAHRVGTLLLDTMEPIEPVLSEPPPPAAAMVTDVRFESTSTSEQSAAPVTFGQAFAQGGLAATASLAGRLPDGTMVPLQLDTKARHPDGSTRHAVISAVLPALAAGQTQTMELLTSTAAASNNAATPEALLAAGFSAGASVTLLGQEYAASADALLRSGKYTHWLAGPIVNEWLVSAPLTTASGTPHPHLTARFAIRTYTASQKTRVDVTIENNWAYEVAPQDFLYDVVLTVGGQPVYSKAGFTHYNHARWRKLFWWGGEPKVHIKHNTAYLLDSKAVPNFDRSIVISETTLASLKTSWTGAKTEPMGVGLANPYMPSTGGRPDIGLLPGWAATYLLSMDKRAKEVTLGTADLAGSWSSHYRNKITDRPVSLFEFPYMTILGNPGDTYNPVTKQREAFPVCATNAICKNVSVHDTSHQPAFAYLPYLVTGDFYYLEELQFWTMWSVFSHNPWYRQYIKGIVQGDQVRGQAWILRNISEAAYITPEGDPLKEHFNFFLDSNIDWYTATYVQNPAANQLGAITHGIAIGYNNKTGIAPWMDDFFTAAIGRAVELGATKALPLLAYKARFPIERMVGAGACWIDGAIYALKVRDSSTSEVYTTIGQAYQASHTAEFNALPCAGQEMATALKLKVGEMTGYSYHTSGYPANMQPALAYSAGVGGAAGAQAWSLFMARSVKPNYATSPQFAIVPR